MANSCSYIVSVFMMLTAAVSGQTEAPCATIRFGFLPSILDENVYSLDDIKSYSEQPMNVSIKNETFPNNCYHRELKRLRFPPEQNGVMRIYDETVLEELSDVDVIIGEYRPGVQSYAEQNSVAYIITTPVGIRLEEKLRRISDDERAVFSSWPSWKDFFSESIQALIRFHEHKYKFNTTTAGLGRVLILFPPGSWNIGVAIELLTNLVFSNSTTWTKVMMLKPSDPAGYYASIVKDELPDIVVFMYDDISQLKIIDDAKAHVQKDKSSKRRHTELFFWDMTKEISGTLRHFLEENGALTAYYFNPYSISVFLLLYEINIRCDDIKYDMTAAIGAVDALVSVSSNALYINSQEFNKTRLLSELRTINRALAPGRYSIFDRPQLWPIIFPGQTYRKGFKHHFATKIGRISPSKREVNESVHYTKCGPRTAYGSYTYENLNVQPGMPNDTGVADKLGLLDNTKEDKTTGINIVVVLEEPFAMKKTVAQKMQHSDLVNSDFSGLTPALTNEIFARMGWKLNEILEYRLYPAPDNNYGSYNATSHKWSGAMGELQDGRAVMAIGMISKTKLRARDFDFSPLFEYVGLTYIRQKYRYPATLFNFMRPFELTVWYAIMVTVILSAVFIYILEYWNPFLHEPDGENKFTWSEVMWYSFGTMSGAGGSFAPSKPATRLFSVVYWFCALVLTATYTGNLASFLTEALEDRPSRTIESLGYTDDVKWATLRDSYMDTFIRNGESFGYKQVARQMEYVESYDQGVARVMDDHNYVFIGNSLLLHLYESNSHDCDLGISHDMVGFNALAFPMAPDWRLKDLVYDVMIEMRDEGMIKEHLADWMQFKYCSGADDDDDHVRLNIDSFYGLFMILSVFTGISFVILAVKLIALKLRERKEKTNGPQQEGSLEEEQAMTDFVEDDGGKSTDV